MLEKKEKNKVFPQLFSRLVEEKFLFFLSTWHVRYFSILLFWFGSGLRFHFSFFFCGWKLFFLLWSFRFIFKFYFFGCSSVRCCINGHHIMPTVQSPSWNEFTRRENDEYLVCVPSAKCPCILKYTHAVVFPGHRDMQISVFHWRLHSV